MMLKTIKILTFALALSVELIMIEESLNYQSESPTGHVLLTQLMQSLFPSNCKMFLENSLYPFFWNSYDYKLIVAGKLLFRIFIAMLFMLITPLAFQGSSY